MIGQRFVYAAILLCTALNALAAPAAPTSTAKPDFFFTYPQPPRMKPRDKMLVAPGYALPPEHERYVWKTTGKNPQGKVRYTGSVPVYYIDPYKRVPIGEIPIGTEVNLDTVTHFRGVMHFRVPFVSPQLDKVLRVGWRGYAWISGEYIKATAYKPAG
ncbi:MAG: hypothetical protein FJ146_04610 [Deltaproteobacteria bacterium]|nr:hypothetical protein [Deltaproteobacteria bacterium]